MASPVARFQLYLLFLSLIPPFLVVEANLVLHPSDLYAISTLWTDFGFPTHQFQFSASRNGNPCHETSGIYCERRTYTESPPVLRVTRIVLTSQGLNGSLSPTIGLLSELKELSLSNNHLVDQIPPHIVDCQKLEVLILRNNHFSGEVPSEVSSLVHLRSLDLSSNRLSGDLSFLRYFPNLENLSLADNLFSGRIPKSLRSFRNLRYLNLTGNNFLQGLVPAMNQIGYSNTPRLKTTTSDFPKRYILAQNSSTKSPHVGGGAIAPSASTTNKSNSSNAEAPSPSTSSAQKHRKSKRKIKGWVIGFFPGVATGFLCGFVASVLFKLVMRCIKDRVKESGLVIFSSVIKKPEDLAFLETEEGLSSLEIVGRGGCGEVYKAELPGSNGIIIAIKKILQTQPQQPNDTTQLVDEESKLLNKKLRQIQSEIRTVGQIRHRNLLALLAHVRRPDCHLLVYEFMKNGSLQDVLNQVSEGTRELEWNVRHRIAMGIASGLEYLHKHHSPRIIHRDLKPANILLNDEMDARIADFGLAKSIPDAKTHLTTSNLAGTVGYIAPEYHQTLKFTDKCDIYSFGVMLAVLVMRKQPSDDFFQETQEMNLVKWLRNILTSEDPMRAIDEKLRGNGYEEQMLLVLKIACFCTVDNPKDRPSSTDVRCMLSQIKP